MFGAKTTGERIPGGKPKNKKNISKKKKKTKNQTKKIPRRSRRSRTAILRTALSFRKAIFPALRRLRARSTPSDNHLDHETIDPCFSSRAPPGQFRCRGLRHRLRAPLDGPAPCARSTC